MVRGSIAILIGRTWVVYSVVGTDGMAWGGVNIQLAVTIILKHLVVEVIDLLLELLW